MKIILTMIITLSVCLAPAAMAEGDKFCPLSGDKIEGSAYAEYQGEKIPMCCKQCVKVFKRDPEKYMSQISEAGHGHESHNHE